MTKQITLAEQLLAGSSPEEPGIGLIEGDCLSVMQGMASGSVGQIVTSPPYNLRNSTGGGFKNNSGGNWPNARLANGYGLCTDDLPRPQYVNPHPAPFPLELAQRCVQASTARVVLDPFNGSGTTGIAAVLEGRDYLGIELEREFLGQSFHRFGTEGSRADWCLRFGRHESAGRAPSYPYLPHVRPQSPATIRPTNPDWPKLMKQGTAARYLSVGVKTLRNLGLDHSKQGRSTVYNRSILDRWADGLCPSSSPSEERANQTRKVEQDFFARRTRRPE